MGHKKCIYIDNEVVGECCKFIASFGHNKQLGTKFCSKHKEPGMINLLCKLCSCGKARPIYNLKGLTANFCLGNTLLCIETDENQHKRYDEKDEEIRYDDLYMLHSGKFIFIRFNPDKYINKNGTRVDPCMKKRMSDLHNEIDKQIERINAEENTELLELNYLFYDGYNK